MFKALSLMATVFLIGSVHAEDSQKWKDEDACWDCFAMDREIASSRAEIVRLEKLSKKNQAFKNSLPKRDLGKRIKAGSNILMINTQIVGESEKVKELAKKKTQRECKEKCYTTTDEK